MLATSWLGLRTYRRMSWEPDRLPRPLLRLLAALSFSGWIATLAGWYVTEIGRQPFIVYGLVRTAEVASSVPSAKIATSLAMYVVLSVSLILSYVSVVRYMAGKSPHQRPETPQSSDAMALVASESFR